MTSFNRYAECCLVPFPIMESEHGASEGIELHRLLDQRREAIDSRPKVNRFAMQINAKVGIKAEHQCSPSAAINAATSVASCREHSSSTVTPFGRCADRRAVGRDAVADCL